MPNCGTYPAAVRDTSRSNSCYEAAPGVFAELRRSAECIDAHDERRSAAVEVSDFDCLGDLGLRGPSGASVVGELRHAVRMCCDRVGDHAHEDLVLGGYGPVFQNTFAHLHV